MKFRIFNKFDRQTEKEENPADLANMAEKAAEKADRLSNLALGISIFALINTILSYLID